MKNVSISEFRANLLSYLTRVQNGERINVSSKGRLLATLIPPVTRREDARAKLEIQATTARIEDVLSPTGEAWDAMK